MKLKYLILPVIICVCGTVKSQNDFGLSQRWFNESIYNHGATGNSFSTGGVFFHSRAQWTGADGASVTNSISVDTYVDNLNSGFGLAVYTDIEFTGIACSEQNDENWIKAINDDKLGWIHLNDSHLPKGRSIQKEYSIDGVPASVLVSPEGKILYREHPVLIVAKVKKEIINVDKYE